MNSVGLIEPAGARVEPPALAILSGRAPIVNVKLTVVVPEVMATAFSPESAVVGVQDQLPEASAVAPNVCGPTVPLTAAPAVVMPENVGVAEVTQNWVAPWINVAPPTALTNPEPPYVRFWLQAIVTRAEIRKTTSGVKNLKTCFLMADAGIFPA